MNDPTVAIDGADKASTQTRSRRAIGVSLAVVMLIAALLRLAYIDSDSLHLDEAWHMELSTGRGSAQLYLPTNEVIENSPHVVWLQDAPPWTAIWTHMDWVIHPPLFHVLLRFWRECAGEGGVRAREFSVLWSVVAIPIFFDLLRRVYGASMAIFGCAIMALAASQIAIAQEVRQYAFLVTLGVATLWVLVRIRLDGITVVRSCGLALLTCAMLLTHYFSGGAVAALAVFSLLRLRGRQRWLTLLGTVAAAVVFAIAWGPTMVHQMSYVRDSADIFLSEPADGHAVRTLSRLATLPTRLTFDPDDDRNVLETLGVGGGAIVLLAAILRIWHATSKTVAVATRTQDRDALLLWIIWSLGIVGSLAALDLLRSTHHLAFTRYAMLASPAVYAIVVAAVNTFGRRMRQVLSILTCVVITTAIGTGYARHNPDVRSTGAYLASIATRDEPLLMVSPNPQGRDAQMVYVGLDLYAKDLFPRRVVILTHRASPDLLEALKPTSTAILFSLTPVLLDRVIPGAVEIDHASPGLGVCYRIRLPALK